MNGKTRFLGGFLLMKNLTLRSVLALCGAVLIAAGCSFARRTDMKTETITLGSGVTVANSTTTIPAGTYQVKIPENSQNPTVQFYRDGKMIAQATGKLQAEANKSPYSGVTTNQKGTQQVLTGVLVQGWNQEVVFKP
jgi:hypothetical protein